MQINVVHSLVKYMFWFRFFEMISECFSCSFCGEKKLMFLFLLFSKFTSKFLIVSFSYIISNLIDVTQDLYFTRKSTVLLRPFCFLSEHFHSDFLLQWKIVFNAIHYHFAHVKMSNFHFTFQCLHFSFIKNTNPTVNLVETQRIHFPNV